MDASILVTTDRPRYGIELRHAIRWWALGAGGLCEGIALSLGFESPAASPDDHWWVRLATMAPDLIRIGLAAAGAFALLLLPRVKAIIAHAGQCATGHEWRPWLALHVVCFAALYVVLSQSDPMAGPAGGEASKGLLALSEALALAAMVSWFLAVAPWRFWRGFVVSARVALFAGIAAGLAAYAGGELAQAYWRPLASGTLFLAEQLLALVYPNVVSDPSRLLLGTPAFLVRIAPQCSGYEGIALITVFLALYFWMFRDRFRFPAALVLFPVAAIAIWLANVLRIAALVAIGSSYSPKLAAGGFHSQAGWIAFIGLAVAAIAVTHRMRFFASAHRADRAEEAVHPRARLLLVPFLVAMGLTIVTASVSHEFDRLYPLRIAGTLAALLYFTRAYVRWDWQWSWPSLCIGAVVFAGWILFEPSSGGAAAGAAVARLAPVERAGWIAAHVIGSVLVAPLVEEMAFRGYLLRRLAAADFERAAASRFGWVPFLVSSAAFGLLHGRWLAGTLAGMAYALAFYRRGKLADAVVAHMTTNGLIALYVLIGGAWWLW